MYCSTCNCEYEGWSGKCPSCKQQLVDGRPVEQVPSNGQIDYSSLVEMIEKNGASIDIDLGASQVIRKKSFRFPWLGFGYAWTQRFNGKADGIHVDLNASEVGKDRNWAFPYRGHGYAWGQEMQGLIAGNQCSLKASEVKRSSTWSFPYSGYGFAWTEEMLGSCGDQIQLIMTASKVSKKRIYGFPYFGHGYAWVDEGILTWRLI